MPGYTRITPLPVAMYRQAMCWKSDRLSLSQTSSTLAVAATDWRIPCCMCVMVVTKQQCFMRQDSSTTTVEPLLKDTTEIRTPLY